MPKFVVAPSQPVEWGAFPEIRGVSAAGPVRSKAVVGGADRPLLLWVHELPPGMRGPRLRQEQAERAG